MTLDSSLGQAQPDKSVEPNLVDNLVGVVGSNALELAGATASIVAITRGSALHGEADGALENAARAEEAGETELAEQNRLISKRIRRQASGLISAGGAGMLTLAALAGEETFFYPEIALFGGSLSAFIGSLSERAAGFLDKIRAGVCTSVAAVMIGVTTIANYSHDVVSSLPPIGLMALTIAYSNAGKKGFAKTYRTLTTGGGAALMTGSAVTGLNALSQGNGTSFVMCLAYFILNGYFTLSEIKQFLKLRRISVGQEEIEAEVEALRNEAQSE